MEREGLNQRLLNNIKTIYRVKKNITKANFSSHKGAFLTKQISVDKFGRKIGFGGDMYYQTLAYHNRAESNRMNIASRGTMLRMLSDTESEVNQPTATESNLKAQRNRSQPSLPKMSGFLENVSQKESVSNLPAIYNNPKERLNTPSYVGDEAYSNFYKKYRRISKEREVSKDGYSASTAFLAS